MYTRRVEKREAGKFSLIKILSSRGISQPCARRKRPFLELVLACTQLPPPNGLQHVTLGENV